MTNINKLYLIYFSPSGSTERVVKKIASGIEGVETVTIDLLTSESRKKKYTFGSNDLVIMGSMTAGKLFTLSDELFACLEGNNTPFTGIITYGNGYYGIALNEMQKRAEKKRLQSLCNGSIRLASFNGRINSSRTA